MSDRDKTWRDRVSDAADSAIKWAKNTRPSPDSKFWESPYAQEHPERPGYLLSEDPSINRPPSSNEIAKMDKAKLKEFSDNALALELKKIGEDLNLDLSDVSSLPRTALRELVRKYGARPYPEDMQDKFQTGWDYDPSMHPNERGMTPAERRELYLKYRKPRMRDFDHSRKEAARRAWDKHKLKEDYAEGLRLNEEMNRLDRERWADQRPDPKYDRQRGSGESTAYRVAPEKGRFEDSSDAPGTKRWVKGKDEVLKDLQTMNEANVIEGGMGLSDKDFRVERD